MAPGTGVPWLNERPSTGTAIWDGGAGTALNPRGEIHLCVLRVDFVEDFTPTTTGDGRFDMSAQPPHGTAYTAGLMDDLSSYLTDVSGGLQDLTFDVHPSAGAFRMPHQMAWYGADSAWVTGVCLLLRDAVQTADGQVDFSAYDAVLVMHAGAGQESDILGDSPDDISSVFLTLADLAYYLPEGGGGYPGIATDDGVFVQEGIIVPETETQDGFGLGVIGTIVHEFMHQLGLPDLYDTVGGGVGVGGWDIMGYGQWMMSGFWPPAPGAWSRADLGWAEVIWAWDDSTFVLEPGGPVLRVPVTGTEYFLVENRLRDPDGDGLCGSHERDFSLQGSGILVWHVDQGVITANRPGNTVNADPAHKGVDLEEADGLQDFDYSLPDIYGIYGSEFDPFFQGGYSHLFGPSSVPSSATSWGGATGVTIEVLDPPGAQISVSVETGLLEDGWPVRLGPITRGPVVWETLGGPLILYTSPAGIIWSVGPDDPDPAALASGASCIQASAVFEGTGGHLLWGASGGLLHLAGPDGEEEDGWPLQLTGSPVSCLLSPSMDAACAATDRRLVYLAGLDGGVLPGWPRTTPDQVAGLSVMPLGEGLLAVSTVSGRVHAWDRGGVAVPGWPVEAPGGEPVSAPLCVDADRDGRVELFLLCGGMLSCFEEDGSMQPGFPAETRGEPQGHPWMCDLDSDGRIEVAVLTTEGVEVFEASGSGLTDWPALIPGDPAGHGWSGTPPGSGGAGFTTFCTGDGRIFAAGGSAGTLPGLPLSVGDRPVGRPAIIPAGTAGSYRLAACDQSGWTALWSTTVDLGQGWFPGLDYSGQGSWPAELLPPLSQGAGPLAGGSFFVYPNPVRGDEGTIRFEPGSDGTYLIRVFNIAGELVSEYSGACLGGVSCEVAWQVRDLSPGLYFVCLEIRGGAGSTEALFEAGVVH